MATFWYYFCSSVYCILSYKYTVITENVITTIKLARKSLLFNKDVAWVKKGEDMFDVTMGSFDGAEICELVGLYLLHKLSKILDRNDVGLYRDGGLAAINNSNGPLMDSLRKKVIALFKEENLNITIDTNLDETDFLDVTFNLNNGKFSHLENLTIIHYTSIKILTILHP